MCVVIAVEGMSIAADVNGRMDGDELQTALATGNIGTIVATAGTTSLGAVDPIDQIVPLAQKCDVRVHLDAAYGGFFALLVGDGDRAGTGSAPTMDALSLRVATAFRAIAGADSIVVDPHKHGLQPYGCGSALFRDAAAGRFYTHHSPYTYFTSDELPLGEISLECSRAGAAAAALWATLQVLPLAATEGLGPIIRKTRAAAQQWAALIRESERLEQVVEPELDIVCFYPLPPNGDRRTSAISTLTRRMFTDLMNDSNEPLYLATLQLNHGLLGDRGLEWDMEQLTGFRSVLMKPEHLAAIEALHQRMMSAINRDT